MSAQTALFSAATPADTAPARLLADSGVPDGTVSVVATHRIEEVEAVWRSLAGPGIESPGQSYDFIRLWVADRGIRPEDQLYLVGVESGRPVALFALRRRTVFGVRVLSWFPGSHVGCLAPLVDAPRLIAMGPDGRRALWRAMFAETGGADLISLRSVPGGPLGDALFGELGDAVDVDTLYRARFSSWEACDRTQRSRSRRKHDRQQGDRLEALGTVTMEELRNGDDTRAVLDTMFRDRSARFRQMGVRDTFVADGLTEFYHRTLAADSGVAVRLHVLRLDGEIVATRYNIVHGDRMFCLISSMTEDERVRNGSPGKQCLLRVMQTIFEDGFSVFDMGAGFTDEKRHWCNEAIPLRRHSIALSVSGRLVAGIDKAFQRIRAAAKADARLMGLWRGLGQVLHGRRSDAAPS